MGAFHYQAIAVLDQATSQLVRNATTGDLYVAATGGSPVAVYDYNNVPVAHLTTTDLGLVVQFSADIALGFMDFGSVRLPIISIEAQNGIALTAQANAAVAASQASADAAAASGQSANDAATLAASAASQSPKSITQNADGSWPARTTVTANRAVEVRWKGTLPGPPIGSGAAQAVVGVDVLYRTTSIPG